MNSNFFKNRKQKLSIKKKESVALFPKNALVELTNACNHACVFCKNPHQKRKTSQLSKEIFKNFVLQSVDLGLEEIGLYATGEPFMTKNISEFIQIAKTSGVKRIYVTTNGVLADIQKIKQCYEMGLNSIKFSINASSAEDYKKIHGHNDFYKVLKNVKDIYEWKRKSKIDLQLLGSCVLIPSTLSTKKIHKSIFGKYFEDIFYFEAGSLGGNSFDIPIQSDEMDRVFKKRPSLSDEEKVQPCEMLWNRVHLTAEGYLTACCVDYDLNLVYSDFKNNSLKDAWNNDLIKNLREKHLNNDLNYTLCNQCLRNKKCSYSQLMSVETNKLEEEKYLTNEKELIQRIIEFSRQ